MGHRHVYGLRWEMPGQCFFKKPKNVLFTHASRPYCNGIACCQSGLGSDRITPRRPKISGEHFGSISDSAGFLLAVCSVCTVCCVLPRVTLLVLRATCDMHDVCDFSDPRRHPAITIIIIKTLYRHQIYLGRGVRPVSL